MPNHVHGIVVIKDYSQANIVQPSGTKPRSLGAVIQNFKSISARKIKQRLNNQVAVTWQRNYYERIIRDEMELSQVRQYIAANPARWKNNV